jgi:hypothetical protein
LADGLEGRRTTGKALQRLPALLQASKHSSGSPQDHPAHLAVHFLGPGHGGTIQNSTQGLDASAGCSGKFTKWIEAKPIKKLDGSSTIKFFHEIITRYGVRIITDNGTNFAKGVFAEYCGQKGIRLDLAYVVHPQSNGQVEKANGLILAGIKPRLVKPLERSAGYWVEELPSVLWSLRTTPNRSIGFTPFFLVYGAEAVSPTDIEFDAPRVV